MRFFTQFLVFGAFFLLISGCPGQEIQAATDSSTSMIPPIQGELGTATRDSGSSTLPGSEGVIQSVIQVDTYTYIQVQQGDSSIWIASSTIEAKEGDFVKWQNGFKMVDFHSKTLDRDFKEILFVGEAALISRDDVMALASEIPVKQSYESSGTVLTVIQVPSYTYLELQQDSGKLWLACANVDAAKGDVVQWDGGYIMQNFVSNALDRTFESILFVSTVAVAK